MIRILAFILALFALPALAQAPPTREIAPYRQAVPGGGELPLYATASWSGAHPGIARVVIVMHGLSRDADTYYATAQRALAAAGPDGLGTLMVAPHILAEEDVAAHNGDAALLRWEWDKWGGGGLSVAPIRISPFEAIDALLLAMNDRARFPDLRRIVLAGHSAGGQVVHRYALAGQAELQLTAAGISLRHVIANPSAYVWFSPDRPLPNGGFGPWEGAVACPGFSSWRYGLPGAPFPDPPSEIEARYISRDITYLLGTLDIDPNHRVLDKTCAAKSQGASRYTRGHAYLAYLQSRHPGLRHRQFDVRGVGHDGGKMLTSACGLAALFDTPSCE
jgi:hypothetical protein